MFVLADNKGYVHDFSPYTGKISPMDNAKIPDLQPCANAVHNLNFDNWFISLPLVGYLAARDVCCYGTAQPLRL